MSLELMAFFGAILVTITACLMLIIDDWRLNVSLLAIQYVGVFALILQVWPLAMSISHMVAGWIAGAVLGMAILSLPQPVGEIKDIEQSEPSTGRLARRLRLGSDRAPNVIFLLISIFLVALAVFSQTPRVSGWIPGLSLTQTWGGLILIGIALLHLGFYSQALRVTIGLLSLFSGFLILYSAINITTLAAALSATIALGLALSGAYLTLAPSMEPG
ncbi:MAG: hypothetical protein A2W35_17465 [Chloroflexi bacterium RBG_16_57_11]|nr:MAG: hypothetical protein A2W35_17465 [Chloroflexi bacterium RBG_16_57_11]